VHPAREMNLNGDGVVQQVHASGDRDVAGLREQRNLAARREALWIPLAWESKREAGGLVPLSLNGFGDGNRLRTR
jgi:hypothetical protein